MGLVVVVQTYLQINLNNIYIKFDTKRARTKEKKKRGWNGRLMERRRIYISEM